MSSVSAASARERTTMRWESRSCARKRTRRRVPEAAVCLRAAVRSSGRMSLLLVAVVELEVAAAACLRAAARAVRGHRGPSWWSRPGAPRRESAETMRSVSGSRGRAFALPTLPRPRETRPASGRRRRAICRGRWLPSYGPPCSGSRRARRGRAGTERIAMSRTRAPATASSSAADGRRRTPAVATSEMARGAPTPGACSASVQTAARRAFHASETVAPLPLGA